MYDKTHVFSNCQRFFWPSVNHFWIIFESGLNRDTHAFPTRACLSLRKRFCFYCEKIILVTWHKHQSRWIYKSGFEGWARSAHVINSLCIFIGWHLAIIYLASLFHRTHTTSPHPQNVGFASFFYFYEMFFCSFHFEFVMLHAFLMLRFTCFLCGDHVVWFVQWGVSY